jgi:hypothetical protein
MKVVVEFRSEARDQLLKLIAARAPSLADALLAATTYCEELVRVLEEHAAPPPGAIIRPRETGAWWLYADGIWVAFTREEKYVGLRPFRRV